MTGPVEAASAGARVYVRLSPGAAHDAIAGLQQDGAGITHLKVSVTAPPEGGKANAALIALLARRWRLPKSSISIIRGASDRWKTLRIDGTSDGLARHIRAQIGERASR